MMNYRSNYCDINYECIEPCELLQIITFILFLTALFLYCVSLNRGIVMLKLRKNFSGAEIEHHSTSLLYLLKKTE